MKKFLAIILTIFMLFTLAACGGNSEQPTEEPTEQPTEEPTDGYTLKSLEGWWDKHEGFEGIAGLYIFYIDPHIATVTSHDSYGNVLDVYKCWYDENGLSIDCGEPFGIVTYTFDGAKLLDDEGNVHYVARNPIDPDDPPYSVDDFRGRWYKNGDELESIVFDGTSYTVMMLDTETETGTVTVKSITKYYDASTYTGPVVELEDESGFTDTLRIVCDGNVLFDNLHGEYYLRETASDDEKATAELHFSILNDDWYTDDVGIPYTIKFTFFGVVWLYSPLNHAERVCNEIGSWEIADGIVRITYSKGGSDEFELNATELRLACHTDVFIRHEN